MLIFKDANTIIDMITSPDKDSRMLALRLLIEFAKQNSRPKLLNELYRHFFKNPVIGNKEQVSVSYSEYETMLDILYQWHEENRNLTSIL